MHVENLASVLTEVDSGELKDQLDERLRAFAEGEIDHASDAFSSLWGILTSSGGGETSRCIRRKPFIFWKDDRTRPHYHRWGDPSFR